MMVCLCCEKDIPYVGPKVCPVCNHEFNGVGWTGIDAHWKAKHEDIMPYHQFWSSLCDRHAQEQTLPEPTFTDRPHQRIGSKSNAHVGREFEALVMAAFREHQIFLEQNLRVPVGINSASKLHAFDLGCEEQKILVECKSHRWTAGGNVPSAKMTTWNEAMYYFHAAPPDYRKLMVVLRDYSEKRNETLLEYYLRTHGHLVPDGVEFWEYDQELDKIGRVI